MYSCEYIFFGPDAEKIVRYMKKDLGRTETLQSNKQTNPQDLQEVTYSSLNTWGKPEVA